MSSLIKSILEQSEIQKIKPDFSILKIIPKSTAQEAQTLVFWSPKPHHIQVLTTNNFPEKTRHIIDLLKQKGFEPQIFYTSFDGFESALDRYEDRSKVQNLQLIQQEKEKKADWKSAISLISEIFEKRESLDPWECIKEIIRLSFQSGASDLHFQAEENGIVLRLRLDGVLISLVEFSHQEFWKYLQKIKFISGVKMNIDYLPQDGRFSFQASNKNWELRTIDARISFMPGIQTENIVIRFLDAENNVENFEEIWFSPEQISILESYIRKTTGIIIVTGPTGSGKTTTLYTILKKLNTWSKKIITLEDPIEYKIAGLQQSQINYDKGYTYELGLKAILRQDPDIILIGETRTKETASIAINAALTWHLVFTTLHTNSALDSLTRLMNMGIEGYLLSPTLQLIIGQRLVRKLCPHCKQKKQASWEEHLTIQKHLDLFKEKNIEIWDSYEGQLWYPGGCPHCNNTGYLWRIAILEILSINEALKDAIQKWVQGDDMEKIAEKSGFLSLYQDGILKVLSGKTSLSEIHRVSY